MQTTCRKTDCYCDLQKMDHLSARQLSSLSCTLCVGFLYLARASDPSTNYVCSSLENFINRSAVHKQCPLYILNLSGSNLTQTCTLMGHLHPELFLLKCVIIDILLLLLILLIYCCTHNTLTQISLLWELYYFTLPSVKQFLLL